MTKKRRQAKARSAPSLSTPCDTAIVPPRSFHLQANSLGVGGCVRLLLRMLLHLRMMR
jgi:hypothetical protein